MISCFFVLQETAPPLMINAYPEIAFLSSIILPSVVMDMGIQTRAGSRVRESRGRGRVRKNSPVTFPFPFWRVMGMSHAQLMCDVSTFSTANHPLGQFLHHHRQPPPPQQHVSTSTRHASTTTNNDDPSLQQPPPHHALTTTTTPRRVKSRVNDNNR